VRGWQASHGQRLRFRPCTAAPQQVQVALYHDSADLSLPSYNGHILCVSVQELTFETQYLAAISLVTAILLGNTFAFSFDRQRQIIAEMSEEVFALELLLQELFIEISEPHLRWRVIKHIKCAPRLVQRGLARGTSRFPASHMCMPSCTRKL
jgi:hypothetical protein